MAGRTPARHVVALTLAALLAAACSGGGDRAGTGRPAAATARGAPVTTTTAPPPPVAPLTGLPDPGGDGLGRPALSVKVGNNPGARPQTGLEDADVVFEEVVEGSITRFLAVFHSRRPALVGPVRSVRLMDPDLVRPIGGIYAYSGGVPGAMAAVRAVDGLRAVNESEAGPGMQRDRSRASPDNLYAVPEVLWAGGGGPSPPPPLFEYAGPGRAFAGDPVARFTVGFARGYDPTYEWDAARGAWARSYGATPFLSASGAQVAPANVVVLAVEYPRPSEGVTVGSGDAWVFSAGAGLAARWERADPALPIRLVGPSGGAVALTPGSTWVALVEAGSVVDVVAGPPPAGAAPAPTTTSTTPSR